MLSRTKKAYRLFGRFGEPSGRTVRLTRPNCEPTSCPSKQPAKGTSGPRRIRLNTTLICGWTSTYFLNRPGQADIQADLFYDYQNNLKSYPKWQQWLRDTQPRLLVLWGRYDPSFTVAGGEAYQRDNPRAEVHILDAGHFALDLQAKEIIRLTQDFMARQGRP